MSNQFSKSLAKGLAVLTCFSPERPTLSVSDISDELGMTRSTAHRYASTLVALRYLQQDEQRHYELAARVSDLGRSALSATPLRAEARLELERLRSDTGCTVGLAVLDGTVLLYIDRLPSHHTALYDVKLPIGAGSRLPADCTAMGKVLLQEVRAGAGRPTTTLARSWRPLVSRHRALRTRLRVWRARSARPCSIARRAYRRDWATGATTSRAATRNSASLRRHL